VPFLMVTTDRGDVRELLDEGGAGFAHYTYDPWGKPTAILNARTSTIDTDTALAIASRQPLRYASYTFDESSGLYYCSRRYYDPVVAAFISKDPARADGEESAYQYCGGDPVGKTDPSGEWAKTVRFSSSGNMTSYLNEVLRVNAGYALKAARRRISTAAKLVWFKNMVYTGCDWDFKRCNTAELTGRRDYLFRGKRISIEEFGNYHFGFVGFWSGMSESYLRTAAREAAYLGYRMARLSPFLSDGVIKHEAEDGRWIGAGYRAADREVRSRPAIQRRAFGPKPNVYVAAPRHFLY
jgi:RHS repeat-associated protein